MFSITACQIKFYLRELEIIETVNEYEWITFGNRSELVLTYHQNICDHNVWRC